MKMPEPIEFVAWGYSEEQLKQYGRDLLEAAAKEMEKMAAVEVQPMYYYVAAKKLQAMKEKL